MKTKFIIFVCLSIVVASCSSAFDLQKRIYRKGFYFHRSSHLKDLGYSKERTPQQLHVKKQIVSESLQTPRIEVLNAVYKKKEQRATVCDFKWEGSKRHTVKNHRLHSLNKNKPSHQHKRDLNYQKKARWAGFKFYLLMTLALFMALIYIANPVFPAVIILSMIFLAYGLVNFYKRKKYKKLLQNPPANPSSDEYRRLARQAKLRNRIFLALTMLFLLSCIFLPAMALCVLICVPYIFIFKARRKKYEILARSTADQTEARKQADILDLEESKKASKAAWLLILFQLLMMAGLSMLIIAAFFPPGFLAFIVSLAGIAIYVFGMLRSFKMAKLAAQLGKVVMKRHPHDKFYPSRRKARFARIAGCIGKIMLVPEIIVLVLMFIASGVALGIYYWY